MQVSLTTESLGRSLLQKVMVIPCPGIFHFRQMSVYLNFWIWGWKRRCHNQGQQEQHVCGLGLGCLMPLTSLVNLSKAWIVLQEHIVDGTGTSR